MDTSLRGGILREQCNVKPWLQATGMVQGLYCGDIGRAHHQRGKEMDEEMEEKMDEKEKED